MKCLFCGLEMEDEEKLTDFHVCPPDQLISINSIRLAMNTIFEEEDDGWTAWAKLFDLVESHQNPVNNSEENKNHERIE